MDEQHQQQQELQPEQPQQQMGQAAGSMDAQQMGNQQSKLPDINQPRTQSRYLKTRTKLARLPLQGSPLWIKNGTVKLIQIFTWYRIHPFVTRSTACFDCFVCHKGWFGFKCDKFDRNFWSNSIISRRRNFILVSDLICWRLKKVVPAWVPIWIEITIITQSSHLN